MNREQSKIWTKLSKAELRVIGESDLARWYEVMEQFANGENVEYQVEGEWRVTINPNFSMSTKFRIKPKMHFVNGFEVPAPIKEYTGQERVYMPSFWISAWAESVSYVDSKELSIKRGAAFETPEAAKANSLAMVGIDPSTYKEQSE